MKACLTVCVIALIQVNGCPLTNSCLAFHDGLDFVSVHEALTEELKSALVSVRDRQSFDRQIETILQQKASAIADKKILPLVSFPPPRNSRVLMAMQVFKQLVRSLLQGKALSVEDVADALSMKDNDTTISDYATALHLLARADVSWLWRFLSGS